MGMSYIEYLATETWRRKALEAKARSGFQCALCHETRSLEAHHRTYTRLGHERPEDLVVLCYWCHRRHHETLVSPRKNAAAIEQLALPFTATIPSDEELN